MAAPRTRESGDSRTLVERLRTAATRSANGGGEWYQLVHRCREAADEIERLREALVEIIEESGDISSYSKADLAEIAQAALSARDVRSAPTESDSTTSGGSDG